MDNNFKNNFKTNFESKFKNYIIENLLSTSFLKENYKKLNLEELKKTVSEKYQNGILYDLLDQEYLDNTIIQDFRSFIININNFALNDIYYSKKRSKSDNKIINEENNLKNKIIRYQNKLNTDITKEERNKIIKNLKNLNNMKVFIEDIFKQEMNEKLISLTSNNKESITKLKLFMNQYIYRDVTQYLTKYLDAKNIQKNIKIYPKINSDTNTVINIKNENNIINYEAKLYFFIEVNIINTKKNKNIKNIGKVDVDIIFNKKLINNLNDIVETKLDIKWYYYDYPIILKLALNYEKVSNIFKIYNSEYFNLDIEDIFELLYINLDIKNNKNIINKNINKNIINNYIDLINQLITIKNYSEYIIFYYEYLKLSGIKNNFYLPIKKLNNKTYKDFLIINYNEKDKEFNNNDCSFIILKILNENPSFIILCTQESSSGKEHYSHVLGENLKNLNYKLLNKEDASTIPYIKNKNVRTRIYYNETKNENKFIIEKIESKISSKSGLGKIADKTFHKGSIFTRLNFKKHNKDYKLIIVNSHLFFNKYLYDTGLNKRKKEFIDIIEEFNLIKEWKDEYSIFFCGDFNFRLYDFNNNIKKYYNTISKNIIKTYIDNNSIYKKDSTEILKKKNQLYKFLLEYLNDENNINSIEEREFYKNLIESIDKLGIHLTSKYKKNNAEKEKEFYKDKIVNKYKEVFSIEPKKNKGFIRTLLRKKGPYPPIPASADKILFSISKNIDINYNFDVLLLPDKSSHKMITLSFELSPKTIHV